MNNTGLKIELDKISKAIVVSEMLDLYVEFGQNLIEKGIHLEDTDVTYISNQILDDLCARMAQDPIAESEKMIYEISRSFIVIKYYRLAHFILNLKDKHPNEKLSLLNVAFKISEMAVLKTCIEIHPEAKIGKRFVIDHGVNTLIGATSEIGDDCTILQNVVFGARKITNNQRGKRHPTIGNNVQISGGVRLLGPIFIGNNSRIGPDCVISEDIPENSTVKVISKNQIIKNSK